MFWAVSISVGGLTLLWKLAYLRADCQLILFCKSASYSEPNNNTFMLFIHQPLCCGTWQINIIIINISCELNAMSLAADCLSKSSFYFS